jgi:flagellar basal-body rod modification protein FlgD
VIDPTTSPQYFGGSTASSSTATSKTSLDKDAFMKLLVAQLSHQDPLNPMDGTQMASQLAQFTSVEQLTQLNSAMTTQTQAAQVATLSSQSALSASLIGRQVEAVGDQVMVPSTGPAEILVDIGGSGGKGTLTLSDSTGKAIATRDLGSLKPGASQTITLPSDLPAGTWTYSLSVKDSGGSATTVTTYSSGIVSGVEFKNGEIVLQAGGLELLLSNLVRIAPAPSASGGATSTTTPTVPAPGRGEGGPLGLPGIPTGFMLSGSHYSN